MPAAAKASSLLRKRKLNTQLANARGRSKNEVTSALAAHEAEAPPAQSDGMSGDESESENNDGIDETGMKRLMKALGEDGLGEFEMAQLGLLGSEEESGDEGGDSDGSESESVAESGDEDDEDDENNLEMMEDGSAASEDEGEEVETEQGEGEDAVSLDGIDDVLDEDTVPMQKLELQDDAALERIYHTIKLDPLLPWTETLTIGYPEPINVDVEDDLNRELAFYKQAIHAADTARKLAEKHKLPFTRPSDFFAEMVKSDAHMERIRQRLLDESATIKRGEQKRKEREGKKFGKQVQLEKAKERERSKKDMDERLKGLKRKRKGALDNAEADDNFDVAVEDALTDRPAKRGRSSGGTKLPRHVRDKKFGFGGAGRRSKQNTKASTDDMDATSRGGRGAARGSRGGRGRGTKRLGKSRRTNAK